MEIAIHLPDDIAQRVQAQWDDIPRHVLEGFVLNGFCARVLTTEDVRRLLDPQEGTCDGTSFALSD